MLSPANITAAWLLEGLQAVYASGGPPTGLEFRGLSLKARSDPIPQLNERLRSPRFGLPMSAALVEALADTDLYRYEPEFADAVMTGLVSLIDFFGGPRANHILLRKLERGELRSGSDDLKQSVATVGARQEASLRQRFEGALRRHERNVQLFLPFLRADLDDSPEDWLDIGLSRIADLEESCRTGWNALALSMGGICAGGQERAVLRGLANGRAEEHGPVLDYAFGSDAGHPEAALEIRHRGFDQMVALRFDKHPLEPISLKELFELRRRASLVDETDVQDNVAQQLATGVWEQQLYKTAFGPEVLAA